MIDKLLTGFIILIAVGVLNFLSLFPIPPDEIRVENTLLPSLQTLFMLLSQYHQCLTFLSVALTHSDQV